jgi:serine/threonine-protein kinase
VFLPRKRPAKILDFGVARLAGGGTTAGGTRAGAVVGTPNYMSPEQVRGSDLDGRSDLFSAGLILYELVTGEKAYKGDSVVALLFKIAHEPADLGLIPRGPSWEGLRRVLACALDHDRDRRYPDARAMSGELAAALLELGGGADWATASNWGMVSRATPLSGSAESAAPPAASLPAMEPAGASSVAAAADQHRVLLAAGALALGAAVLLALALFALRGRSTPGPVSGPALSAAAAPSPPAGALPTPGPTLPSATPPSSRPSAVAPALPSQPPVEPPPRAPAPAGASADKAGALLEQGRYAAALGEARAVLQRDPANAEARTVAEEAEAALVIEGALRKAREALKRGDKEAALEQLKVGLAVNSNERRLLELWRQATQ